MADPTFRSSTTQDLNSPASITVGKPTGTLSTDVVILLIESGSASSGAVAGTWAAPSGWAAMTGSPFNVQFSPGGTPTNTKMHLWWALGSVNFANTFTQSGGNGTQYVGVVCEAWSNVDTTTPIDVISASISSNISSTTLSLPAVTTVTDRALPMYAAADVGDGQMSSTGYTKVENGAAQQAAALNYKNSVLTPAGSTGSVTVSDTVGPGSQGLVGLQFALRPAGSGGTTYNLSMSGGGIMGGSSTTQWITSPLMSGGELSGGSLAVQWNATAIMSGGGSGGGAAGTQWSATAVMNGGAVGGGTVNAGTNYNPSISGGVTSLGGAGIVWITSPVMSGGEISGGSFVLHTNFNPAMSGGESASGSASVITVYAPTMSGGEVGGGTASTGAQTYTLSMTGGEIGGGSGAVIATYNTAISGGGSTGGSSSVAAVYRPTSSGGGSASGSASTAWISSPKMAGGVSSGGSIQGGASYSPQMAGGGSSGGSGGVNASYAPGAFTGGAFLSGVAGALTIYRTAMTGGGISGGVAIVNDIKAGGGFIDWNGGFQDEWSGGFNG